MEFCVFTGVVAAQFYRAQKKSQQPHLWCRDLVETLVSFAVSRPGHHDVGVLTEESFLRFEKATKVVAHVGDVKQIVVLKQGSDSACGYFAFYNTLWAARSLLSSSQYDFDESLRILSDRYELFISNFFSCNTGNRGCFWHHFFKFRKALLDYGQTIGGRFPFDSDSLLSCDVCERAHMQYLLSRSGLNHDDT